MNEKNNFVTVDVLNATIEKAIERLAQIINIGFKETAKDISILIERIDKIEKEISGAQQKFDTIFFELKKIREEIKTIDTRAEVRVLDARLTRVEREIGTRK